MRPCEISIYGFRCIKKLEHLRLEPFASLVGQNDAGKSTVLLAMKRFFDGKGEPADLCRVGECAPGFHIDITFDRLAQEVRDQLSAERALDGDGRVTLRRAFALEALGKGELLIVCDDYAEDDLANLPGRTDKELNDLVDKYRLAPVGESGRGKTNVARWQVLWNHAEQVGLKVEAGRARSAHKTTQSLLNAALPHFYLFASDQSLDTSAAAFQSHFKSKVAEAIGPMDELRAIRHAGEQAIAVEIKAISQILTDQTQQVKALGAQVEVDPEKAATVVLQITDIGDFTSNLEDRGLGTQRLAVVAFLKRRQQLTAGSPTGDNGGNEAQTLPTRYSVYAIEEPETYLHPAGQRDFYYDLRRLSQAGGTHGYQVVTTTHSTTFVDRMRPDEIALIRRDKQGITSAHQVSVAPGDTAPELERLISEELGVRNSDYFFANCVLCLEGDAEYAALPQLAVTWLGTSLDEMGVQPVNLSGSGNAGMFLQAAVELGVPRVLLIDEEAEHSLGCTITDLVKRGLVAEDHVFPSPRELASGQSQGDFEYQFPDELLAAAATEALAETGQPTDAPPCELTQEDIAQARSEAEAGYSRKLGHAIRKLVYTQGRHELSKARLGKAIGRLCQPQQVPDRVRSTLNKAAEYSGRPLPPHGVGEDQSSTSPARLQSV